MIPVEIIQTSSYLLTTWHSDLLDSNLLPFKTIKEKKKESY
jgi:hypothetical protein